MEKTAYTLETNKRIKFIVSYAPVYGQAKIRSRHYTRARAEEMVAYGRAHGEAELHIHEIE